MELQFPFYFQDFQDLWANHFDSINGIGGFITNKGFSNSWIVELTWLMDVDNLSILRIKVVARHISNTNSSSLNIVQSSYIMLPLPVAHHINPFQWFTLQNGSSPNVHCRWRLPSCCGVIWSLFGILWGMSNKVCLNHRIYFYRNWRQMSLAPRRRSTFRTPVADSTELCPSGPIFVLQLCSIRN